MARFEDLLEKRRSVYDIGRDSAYTGQDVAKRLKELVSYAPSAFNSQTSRFVVIDGQDHERVWDMIDADQKDLEGYENIKERFAQARKGLGTVLLFEDQDEVEALPTGQERAERYMENNHGIAALLTWLALAEMDLGASLQHHNIGYDDEIKEYLGLDGSFRMLAQMPFGSVGQRPSEKNKIDVDEQVIYIA